MKGKNFLLISLVVMLISLMIPCGVFAQGDTPSDEGRDGFNPGFSLSYCLFESNGEAYARFGFESWGIEPESVITFYPWDVVPRDYSADWYNFGLEPIEGQPQSFWLKDVDLTWAEEFLLPDFSISLSAMGINRSEVLSLPNQVEALGQIAQGQNLCPNSYNIFIPIFVNGQN